MFNLNMDMTTNLPNERQKDELPEGSGTNTELSGTSSSSSVVNADISTAGEFDFFPQSKSFVTHQLFPMSDDVRNRVTLPAAGGGGGGRWERELLGVGSSSQTTTNQQWLNLSVSDSSTGMGVGLGMRSGSGSGSEPHQLPEQGGKQQVRKSRRGPRSRSSQYRGVTFYRRTGRWESHIWDCGKQVYLGGFDTAHAAARAYDRAAIKFRGVDADINFNIVDYDEDMKQMKDLSKEEFVQVLRRQTNGFARGSSRYRGVTLHKCGQWDARMDQFLGKKGYDKAGIQSNGQIPFQANIEGSSHNLDLNLGISMAMDGQKASNSMGVHQESHTSHHSSFQLAMGKRPMPMNGSSNYPGGKPLYGQPLVPRQSNTAHWSGLLPPGLSATYEGNDTYPKTTEVNNSMSSFTPYMQDPTREGGGTNRTMDEIENRLMLLSSTTTGAASSGFSYSTPPTSATRNPEIQISNPRPPHTPSSNTGHYPFLHNHHSIHRI